MNLGPRRRVPGGSLSVDFEELDDDEAGSDGDDKDDGDAGVGRTGNQPLRHSAQQP